MLAVLRMGLVFSPVIQGGWVVTVEFKLGQRKWLG